MRFGENLKKLRKQKKLSQEDLAEKVNVSRQSVSKWETGDAYPEMNNILELCKIFHCRINDLVNDTIVDVDSLDEEVRITVVKFKIEQQKKMKGLSKAIALISKICKILVTVAIPSVIASMIVLIVLITKLSVSGNTLTLNGHNVEIKLIETEKDKYIKIDDKEFRDDTSLYVFSKTIDILNDNNKTLLIIYVTSGFAFLTVCLFLVRIMLSHLEKLFENINGGDTPFTLENVTHIKAIAYLMIVVTLLPDVMGIIFEIVLAQDLDVGFELFSVVEILFLFSIAYIFQYGYEIQLDSKGKMYGDEYE